MKVYFIQAGENGPVKIGKAKNVERRLSNLQIGNHVQLKVILVFACDSQKEANHIERKFHKVLKKWRMQK